MDKILRIDVGAEGGSEGKGSCNGRNMRGLEEGR